MKKIKKVGRTQPRESVNFYKENPDLFDKLQHGEIIEVPDQVFSILKGVKEEEVFHILKEVKEEEDRVDDLKTSLKFKSKKKSFGKTMTGDYTETNKLDDKFNADIIIKHNEDIKIEDEKED